VRCRKSSQVEDCRRPVCRKEQLGGTESNVKPRCRLLCAQQTPASTPADVRSILIFVARRRHGSDPLQPRDRPRDRRARSDDVSSTRPAATLRPGARRGRRIKTRSRRHGWISSSGARPVSPSRLLILLLSAAASVVGAQSVVVVGGLPYSPPLLLPTRSV